MKESLCCVAISTWMAISPGSLKAIGLPLPKTEFAHCANSVNVTEIRNPFHRVALTYASDTSL